MRGLAALVLAGAAAASGAAGDSHVLNVAPRQGKQSLAAGMRPRNWTAGANLSISAKDNWDFCNWSPYQRFKFGHHDTWLAPCNVPDWFDASADSFTIEAIYQSHNNDKVHVQVWRKTDCDCDCVGQDENVEHDESQHTNDAQDFVYNTRDFYRGDCVFFVLKCNNIFQDCDFFVDSVSFRVVSPETPSPPAPTPEPTWWTPTPERTAAPTPSPGMTQTPNPTPSPPTSARVCSCGEAACRACADYALDRCLAVTDQCHQVPGIIAYIRGTMEGSSLVLRLHDDSDCRYPVQTITPPCGECVDDGLFHGAWECGETGSGGGSSQTKWIIIGAAGGGALMLLCVLCLACRGGGKKQGVRGPPGGPNPSPTAPPAQRSGHPAAACREAPPVAEAP